MRSVFFNAHHSPIGAFASFTLGQPGASGGFGLELGSPANQSVYIGLQSPEGDEFDCLPFYPSNFAGTDLTRFQGEQAAADPDLIRGATLATLRQFNRDALERRFGLSSDTWSAGDLSFTLYSPVMPVPALDREHDDDAAKRAVVPAVLAEITVDNTHGAVGRRAFFGYAGTDEYSNMRRIVPTNECALVGVGQGRITALATLDAGVTCGMGFAMESIVAQTDPQKLTFDLGMCGALLMDVAPAQKRTFRFAAAFFRGGYATAGMDTKYYYTTLFPDIESVCRFALDHFDDLKASALEADALTENSGLSEDQKFMVNHSVRSYYGSTQLLQRDGKPIWVVNEGEYRMMNTLDLVVDQLFYELTTNSWTVRNVLDLYSQRYSYDEPVRFHGETAEHPGGISFTHDMGVGNVFSRPEHSSYEQSGLTGCFSYMTQEQLLNWICSAAVYVSKTSDDEWRICNTPLFEKCLTSMMNRDDPDDALRTGVMSLDSARVSGGSEITTYDSLDESLSQARGNLYIAVKCWAAYVLLEQLMRQGGMHDRAAEAQRQAMRCAATIVGTVTEQGALPALLDDPKSSKIIPAIEPLVYPFTGGCQHAVEFDGPYGLLIRTLKQHLENVLVPGTCLFEDGAWKLSSTADNSWLSKIYLCQFVARTILGIDGDNVTAAADRAHVAWLTDPSNTYWAWSDQMVLGKAIGSRYYPRGVTSILWLDERDSRG